jgi:hypothetical protein
MTQDSGNGYYCRQIVSQKGNKVEEKKIEKLKKQKNKRDRRLIAEQKLQ